MDEKKYEGVGLEELEELPEVYEQLAGVIGIEATLLVAEIYGGEQVYFPKIEAITRPVRNGKIKADFDGYNFGELAKKYNLTKTQIRQIVSEHINEVRSRPLPDQVRFFEDE